MGRVLHLMFLKLFNIPKKININIAPKLLKASTNIIDL